MGQKVHPESMRVGYIHDWKSNWFNERHFSDFLIEDVRIRDHITNKLAHAGLSDITIRKDAGEVEINIHTARPGIVIGKSGSEVDALRKDLHRLAGHVVQLLAQRIHLGAGLADHDAGPGGVDVDRDLLLVLSDMQVGQAGMRQLGGDVIADLEVLPQVLREVLCGREPVRLPGVDDADAQAAGMNLLSH